jgi:WD40 repeat protein
MNSITRISVLIFVLLLATIGRYYYQSQQDTKTKDLLGLALIQSGTNPLEGLNTLLGLWETDSSSTQLHYIILKNLQNVVSIKADTLDPLFPLQEYLKPVNTGSLIINAELSKSGKYIYGWLENQDIFILEVKSKKIRYAPVHGDICDMKLSEEDLLCALVFGNNTGMICNFNGDIKYSFETTLNEVMNKKLTCFFPPGDNQLAVVKDKEVVIYNKTGQIVSELKGHTGDINSVDISPDGKFIATASSDRQAYIWNYNFKIKQYGIYDSLVSHKDIVWSCRFNKTGKYIITASADSTIKIWDLNGTQLNPEFHFLVDLNTNFYRYRYNNGEYDGDASNPEFSKYYSTFCDAEFGIDEKEIIATGYNIKKVGDDAGKPEFQDVLFFDVASSFPKAAGSTFYFSGIATDTVIPKNFRKIVLSPNMKVAAGSDSKSDRITIFAGDRQNLLTLNGKFPMFPGDGNELFWIDGNEIFRLPVVPDEIKHQFDTYKISWQSKEFDNIRIGY